VSTPPHAQGSFTDLFSGHAPLYAAARPSYPDALFDWLAAQAPARDRAWDCGCGSGQAAVALARHFGQVLASDPSAEQIAHARAHERVVYSVQAAEATDLPPTSVDLLCVAQALHWFDLPRFWVEARRVMRPGALFAAWGYSWMQVSPAFDAAMRGGLLQAIESLWVPQNRLLWAGYQDLDLPLQPVQAPPFEIRVDWSLPQLLDYVQTWSAVRRLIARDGQVAFERLAAGLARHWGDAPEATRTVTMPLALRAGRHAP
jgi:SAM-dependent methyltransferase